MDKSYRIETDSIGEIQVSNEVYWGAQTQRSLQNFNISDRIFPTRFIKTHVELKRACAIANKGLGLLDTERADAIIEVSDKIIAGQYLDQFPLDVFQTGSGTQTNMNVNEVIANLANESLGKELGSKYVHPNNHVNLGQSSNDTIPTSMHIAALVDIHDNLLIQLDILIERLQEKEQEYWNVIKVGRTHLQDAVPLSLGQEFSGYINQLKFARDHIINTSRGLLDLAIGGTAVGTGLNAHPDLGKQVAAILSERFGMEFNAENNKFALISSKDRVLAISGALRTLAVSLMKLANDIRWLASGPRAGLGELILPTNEPGSSIMPGKVNPTQSEMLIQVAAQVIGNDTTINIAAQNSILELNMMMPLLVSNLLESIDIMSQGILSFADKAIEGLKVNEKKIADALESSLMIVTALTKHPKIDYDLAAKVAKEAHKNNKSIREVITSYEILTEKELKDALNLISMVNLERSKQE
ncbi:MAG: class II fumarate hydratase [Candidatus Heimdallarchaeota archaeon]|nr:class II fumarate hydratase [Candidatus Heimdallarchaeota archaeon]